MDEQQLVKLYMDLTGTPEPVARNVFMMIVLGNGCGNSNGLQDPAEPQRQASTGPPAREERASSRLGIFLGLIVLLGLFPGIAAAVDKAPALQPFNAPLSLADAVDLALHQSPAILRAQKELEASQGIAIQSRAIALPAVGLAGSYGRVQRTDVDVLEAPGFTFGTPQNWSSQVKIVQSIYQGGRMLSGFRAAQLVKEQALLTYQTTAADTILSVQLAFYDVLLAAQLIVVQQASVELLTNELVDTRRRFEAGTVPRFNVLRAEVELANARPKLITARNSLRIAKNNLANLLGLNVPTGTQEEVPLNVVGRLQAEPEELGVSKAIEMAWEKRTELGVLRKTEALRKEDITTAKAGYKPVLQAYAGYDFHNSLLSSDLSDTLHGWMAGAQLSWNLFDGFRTQGRIKEATANYERAGIDLDDKRRGIELEVRTDFSNFTQAREVLASQEKVVEEGEEALRLARARAEAGTGTQLDVLSAQTALTEARTTQIQALHDYEVARARLQRAVGLSIPSEAAR